MPYRNGGVLACRIAWFGGGSATLDMDEVLRDHPHRLSQERGQRISGLVASICLLRVSHYQPLLADGARRR